MFGMSGTEMIIILVLALLLFGPDRLPQMAKMLGKGMREFQKATGDIRSTVESEFNKLAELEPDKKPEPSMKVVELKPPEGTVAAHEPRIAPPALVSVPDEPKVEPAPQPPADEKAPS